MSGETGSSVEQNVEFKEPESGADLKAIRVCHQDLKTVQGHVTGATEVVDLGVIHDHLAEIRTVFGHDSGGNSPPRTNHQHHSRIRYNPKSAVVRSRP